MFTFTAAEGWLQDGLVYGRPVDIQEMPDGSLLVSGDLSGSIICRIRHQ